MLQKNPLYSPERCCAFQCDLTKDDLRENVPEGSVDVITLIFVLSAVHPDKMKLVLQNISRVRIVRNVIVSFLWKAQIFIDMSTHFSFPLVCVDYTAKSIHSPTQSIDLKCSTHFQWDIKPSI